MIRLTTLLAVAVLLTLYAWKDWYKSLCGLIVLMAFLQHPDMPRTLFGVKGLNPWNILFFAIVIAWLGKRRSERLRWDMPRSATVLLLLNLGVLVLGLAGLIVDRRSLPYESSIAGLTGEHLFSPVKWALIGILLFDGCRSRRRLLLGLASILSLYFLLGLQVARTVSPGASSGRALSSYALRRLDEATGYHRNDLSTMLAGASWAILAATPLVSSSRLRGAILVGALTVLYAQALTGGRGGYLAWCTVGLTLGLLRWHRYLVLAPLILISVVSLFPAVAERALWGIHPDATTASEEIDVEEFTAGRTTVWPKVIEKSLEAPVFGHGTLSFQRTGLSAWWASLENPDAEGATHPHNAYLEMLLDNGVVGLLVVLSLYAYLLTTALPLLLDRRRPVFAAVGGLAISLILAQLVGSFTGQSFYPREATVGMWCAIGLLLRVSVQRSRAFALHSAPPAQVTGSARSNVGAPRDRPLRQDEPWWRSAC